MSATRAGLLLSLALAGCFPELGEFDASGAGGAGEPIDHDEDWVPSGGAGGLGAGGAGGAGLGGMAPLEACDSGLLCLDASGREGWSGPFLVLAGADSECPAAYPEPASALHELVAWSNPCDCSCGAAQGVQCTARLTLFDDPACEGTPDATLDVGPACQSVVNTALGARVTLSPTGGSCAPMVGAAQTSTSEITLCGSAWGECSILAADGTALPGSCQRPPDGAQHVCWLREGDQACQGGFPLKRLVYAEEPAPITCSAASCGCGSAGGAACSGDIEVNDAGCGTATAALISGNNTCVSPTALDAAASVDVLASAAGGGCAATSLVDLGDVSTLCCATSF